MGGTMFFPPTAAAAAAAATEKQQHTITRTEEEQTSRASQKEEEEEEDRSTMSEVDDDDEEEDVVGVRGFSSSSQKIQAPFTSSCPGPDDASSVATPTTVTVKASEVYMESSPSRRHRHRPHHGSVAGNENGNENESTSMGYKSKVQRLIQKMEQQQAELLKTSNQKSIDFRKRMDELIKNDSEKKKKKKKKKKVDDNEDKEIAKDVNEEEEQDDDDDDEDQYGNFTISFVPNNDPIPKWKQHQHHDTPAVATVHKSSQCTASTRSISASSWSTGSATSSPKLHLQHHEQQQQQQQQDDDDEEEEGYKMGEDYRVVDHHLMTADGTTDALVTPRLQVVHVHHHDHHPSTTTTTRTTAAAVTPTSMTTSSMPSPSDRSLSSPSSEIQTELVALRSLHKAYKQRFQVEQKEKQQLQDHITLLKSYLNDTQHMNAELRSELHGCKRELHKQQILSMKNESDHQHRLHRIQRDLDRLWKQYKALQEDHTQTLVKNNELQDMLRSSNDRQQKYEKEKQFLKEKSMYLQTKINKLKQQQQPQQQPQQPQQAADCKHQ
jgi:hypothetical protein